MFARFKRSLFAVVVLGALHTVANAADVSVHDVYAAAQAGHMGEAQTMMQQVLRDHPNSAKAHYIDAELLAKTGDLAAARTELATAERLEPGLSFASSSAVRSLQARLADSPAGYKYVERPQFPWGLALLVIALIVAVVMFVRALRQRSMLQANSVMQGPGANGPYAGPQVNYGQPGYGPNMGPMSGGGMGGGILGGLATGAALGAGMVAGEALAHHLMGDGHTSSIVPDAQAGTLNDAGFDPNSNMGGADFGINDTSSWGDGGSSWDSGGGDLGGDSWS